MSSVPTARRFTGTFTQDEVFVLFVTLAQIKLTRFLPSPDLPPCGFRANQVTCLFTTLRSRETAFEYWGGGLPWVRGEDVLAATSYVRFW